MILHYALCNVSVMPMRKEASHKAETSQLLYGEKVEVTHVDDRGWAQIRTKWDGYNGWCKMSQLSVIPKKDFLKDARYIVVKHGDKLVTNESEILLPIGSELMKTSFLAEGIEMKFKGKKQKQKDLHSSPEALIKVAKQYLHAPYQWGGRTIAGIDCSGLTQMAYRLCNQKISRDASLQASEGTAIDFLQNAQAGDLAFFDNEEGRINHVGLLIDNQTIIHATDTAGCVVIDKIDQGGIISSRLKMRTHNLRLVKRYI